MCMYSVSGLAYHTPPRWKRMRCDAGKQWKTDLILGCLLLFGSRPLQLLFASAWVGNCQSTAEGLASPDDTLEYGVDRLWSEGTVRHSIGAVRYGTGDVVLGQWVQCRPGQARFCSINGPTVWGLDWGGG